LNVRAVPVIGCGSRPVHDSAALVGFAMVDSLPRRSVLGDEISVTISGAPL